MAKHETEFLIEFLIFLHQNGHINDYDFDWQKVSKQFLKRRKHMQTVWSVTPDSVRINLADKNTPAAYFVSREEAELYGQKYGNFAIIKQIKIQEVPS